MAIDTWTPSPNLRPSQGEPIFGEGTEKGNANAALSLWREIG